MDEERKPKYSVATILVEAIVLIAIIVFRVMGKITTAECVVGCLIIIVFTARWFIDAVKSIMNGDGGDNR